MSKLTPEIVTEMRRLRCEGLVLAEIAAKFLVDDETVREVITVKSWRKVKTKYDDFLVKHKNEVNRHPLDGIKVAAELVRKIFSYSKDEGILRWNIRGRAIQFGKKAGSSSVPNGHLSVCIGGEDFVVTRIIWLFVTGKWPERLVDHKDRNKRNNKWGNLRQASVSQNAMNSKIRSDNTSGHKGVFLDKNGTYRAYINVNKRCISLGFNMTFEEAVAARLSGEARYHGEFAIPPGSTGTNMS